MSKLTATLLSHRYHKNKREQKPGWNREIIEWCKQAALEKNLKDCDYWGGFVIDEMKIEVRNRIGINTVKTCK